jgi:hypothetical protein
MYSLLASMFESPFACIAIRLVMNITLFDVITSRWDCFFPFHNLALGLLILVNDWFVTMGRDKTNVVLTKPESSATNISYNKTHVHIHTTWIVNQVETSLSFMGFSSSI